MAIKSRYKDKLFGVGDYVKVVTEIEESDKKRSQIFEGIVIKIKGENENKSITVRKIGTQQIGIERIFPLNLPQIKDIKVLREGTRGIRRAKLYYLRDKSKKEIENIYSRSQKRKRLKKEKVENKKRSKSTKNASSKEKK